MLLKKSLGTMTNTTRTGGPNETDVTVCAMETSGELFAEEEDKSEASMPSYSLNPALVANNQGTSLEIEPGTALGRRQLRYNMSNPADRAYPVAIGGIGGSGTRLGAALLRILGYYIGDDLNGSLDNLWFTLLFKRRSILSEDRSDFCGLVSLFFSRMSGEAEFSNEQRVRVLTLAGDDRIQHPQDWLRRRAELFIGAESSRRPGQPCGWKEPNTHIIIDRLLEIHPDLRYIHFTRHPLDMAFSSNQNQLENWGPVLLNRDVAKEPRQSLAYWCAAHRRMKTVMQQWPERTIGVDFDELCADPQTQSARLATFLGAAIPDHTTRLCDLIEPGRLSSGRFKSADLTQFFEADMSYVRELGYAV
jgi:Sulfotransferase family